MRQHPLKYMICSSTISYNFKIQNREALDAAIARATARGDGHCCSEDHCCRCFRDKNGPGINSDAALKWALPECQYRNDRLRNDDR
ncbi:MAG: hypothetical protein MZV63_31425 [Marinilabiliales bacterium]|nr:hypothetical protein [Marinilabiliales bacterium]